MKRKKILVVGDLILDTYLHGTVDRISPEAPIPVLRKSKEQDSLGGAGNLAANIQASNSEVELIGIIGRDSAGKKIRKLTKQSKLKVHLQEGVGQTTHKMRVASGGQQIVRIDNEAFPEEKDTEQVKKQFNSVLGQFSLVVLSDYDKGTLNDPQYFINLCRRNKIDVMVDPKKLTFKSYRWANYLTPNLKEIQSCLEYNKNISLEENTISICKKLKINNIIVTLGSQGIMWGNIKGEIKRFNAQKIDVTDVTGAGDTFLAYLASTLLKQKNITVGIEVGIKAASIAVSKLGTYILKIDEMTEINQMIKKRYFPRTNWQEFLQKLKSQRKERENVVFTNGCFDILHSGHLDYLDQSSEYGQIFVVGINSDKSISILKGERRPVNKIETRVKALLQLACIDFVVEFDQETPLELIKLIKPDVLIKGDDYSQEEIVGRSFVEQHGGKVKLLKFNYNISTTQILKALSE